MNILYHHPLCPLSRQIRALLTELNIEFQLIREYYWLRRKEFLQKNPAGTIPILEIEQNILVGNYAIIEYINETNQPFFLMPESDTIRAKVRQCIWWFNDKFYRDVAKILIDEKMIRLLTRSGEPRSTFIRAAKYNLVCHFKFLTNQLEQHSFVASEKISCADITVAAHISVVDYFGEVNWDNWELIKQWYSIVKSRPSFQSILADRIPGFTPAPHYSNLDF